MDKNFRGLNFNAYCQNKRTLESISKKLTKQHRNEKNKKIIMGFGDFSQKDGLGCCGAIKRPKPPILKIKHHLRQRCFVIDIDEYNTSKTCSCCHNKVEQYKNHTIHKMNASHLRNGTVIESKRKRGVYKVIRCERFAPYNECKLSCMDRDVNAKTRSVHNMLFLSEKLLGGEKQHVEFSRYKRKS